MSEANPLAPALPTEIGSSSHALSNAQPESQSQSTPRSNTHPSSSSNAASASASVSAAAAAAAAAPMTHPLDPAAPIAEIDSHPHSDKDRAGSATPPVPKVHLRALIISGQTHVYSFEPELTVGRMKELIWNSWPSEWTDPAQPPSPSYLRVLHAGRILQDDSTLGSNLMPSTPTVIHISVRSFSIRNDDEPKKPALLGRTTSAVRSHRDDDVGGCKCVIM